MIALSRYFLEPIWSYALLLVVLFLLLYLIKPKPKYQVMPTLMFLFKDLGRNRNSNLLRRLVTNLLFLIQLLLMLSILLAIAKPYINVSKESLFKNTVIVLDTSASMKTGFEGETRFSKAVSLAKSNLGSINTLVLVKRNPEAAMVDESSGKVKDYLSKLQPTDDPTNLYSAISTAGAYAKSDSRVVVISDFIDTETDTDLNTIKKTLEAQGIKVDFIRVFSEVQNVGIVDLQITDSKTTAVIKNYNKDEVEVDVKINELKDKLKIKPDSKELFTFSTPPKTSKLEIDTPSIKDSFMVDNAAYVSAPSDVKKKILFITNNNDYSKSYLYNAMDVMKNVEITVAIPPKIPSLEGYDVYVFKGVNPNLILPGTFKGVKKEIEEKGKAAIITGQPDMLAVDYQGLMPLRLTGEIKAMTNIQPSGSDSLTNNIDFGITKRYFNATPLEGVTAVPIAYSDDKVPLIAFASVSGGRIFYYGIIDEDKEAETFFGKSPAYFVFWKRAVDMVTNTPSLKNLNFKTGTFLSLGEEQKVTTPSGKVTTNSLALDNSGLYTLKDRTVAINLIDEKESDVSNKDTLVTEGLSQGGERFKEKVPFELTNYLVFAAIILLFLELIYVKMRGDF
jgi:hypothetical protein